MRLGAGNRFVLSFARILFEVLGLKGGSLKPLEYEPFWLKIEKLCRPSFWHLSPLALM